METKTLILAVLTSVGPGRTEPDNISRSHLSVTVDLITSTDPRGPGDHRPRHPLYSPDLLTGLSQTADKHSAEVGTL